MAGDMKNSFLNLILLYLVLIYPHDGISAESQEFPNSTFIPANPAVTPTIAGQLNSGRMSSVLPADEAFALDVIIELPATIVVKWEIMEGYYLYRKSFEFVETNSSITGTAIIPQGRKLTDEFFGDVEVYFDNVMVRIPFNPAKTKEIELLVSYQGCAEIGFCYPVQQKIVTLEIF